MSNVNTQTLINIDDTRFIYATNFSGDPARDRFGDSRRKVNLVIPSEEKAKELTKMGFKVKKTKPKDGVDPDTFRPEYYLMVQTKYRDRFGNALKYPPKVCLVTNNNIVDLNEETVGCLDNIRVKNVNCIFNPRENDDGDGLSAFVRTMYVEQDMDDDPYAARYRQRMAKADELEEDPW